MSNFNVTWELTGNVNGCEFTVHGAGTADSATGRHDLTLTAAPSYPQGFDPSVTEFICNFPPAGYSAASSVEVAIRDAVDTELHVSPSRIARIYDESGEEVARLEALTTMRVEGSTIVVSNWLTGTSNLSSPVVAASGSEVLIPAGPGRATGTAHFTVELADGTKLNGLTVVPYRFDRDDVAVTPAVREVTEVAAERIGDDRVTLSARSEWLPLAITVR